MDRLFFYNTKIGKLGIREDGKNIKYKANNIYNLTVSVYNNKNFANRLMQIFGDAADRNMAPHNVIINNADKSLNLYSNIITIFLDN